MSKPNSSLYFVNPRTEHLEGEAVEQMEAVLRLPHVERVIGLPDLHPGKGVPVGTATVTRELVYPHLIGNDIGCGMTLVQTDANLRKLKLGKLEDRIFGLEDASSAEERVLLDRCGVARTKHDRSLGTIGGGNHFAELLAIDEIHDTAGLQGSGINSKSALLLIHSGSRGLGEQIYRSFVDESGATGLSITTELGQSYLRAHDHAVLWAKANRELIALRFLHFLRAESFRLLDLPHNFVERTRFSTGEFLVHRKGAASANHPLLIIPGSRGSLSYLVRPIGPQEKNAYSLSHGAGRKWRRSECRKRLSDRFERSALLRTALGGRVVCEDVDLLYEEAPDAYKNIKTVVEALRSANLIEIVATLRPLLTYKTRKR